MKFDHVFWTYRQVRRGCVVKGLVGFEDDFEISLGTPVLSDFPSNVTVSMHPDFPEQTICTDNLPGWHRLASERMGEFLRSKNLRNVEFLPVSLINHRGRTVKPSYELVHPIHAIDCLDYSACGITYSDPDDEEYIDELKSFVLDANKCDDFPSLFRVEKMADYILIHRDLARELDELEFTGNGWIEPSYIGGVDLGAPLPIHRLDD